MKNKEVIEKLNNVKSKNSELCIMSILIDFVYNFYNTVYKKRRMRDLQAIERAIESESKRWMQIVCSSKFINSGLSDGFTAILPDIVMGLSDDYCADIDLMRTVAKNKFGDNPNHLSFFRFFRSIEMKIIVEQGLERLVTRPCNETYDRILRLGNIDPSNNKNDTTGLWDFCERYGKPVN